MITVWGMGYREYKEWYDNEIKEGRDKPPTFRLHPRNKLRRLLRGLIVTGEHISQLQDKRAVPLERILSHKVNQVIPMVTKVIEVDKRYQDLKKVV